MVRSPPLRDRNTTQTRPCSGGTAVSEPWQHYYQSQRLKLAYWTWGDASKPPLVLVHGGQDHARNWDRLAEAFRDDYYVIACDLRGHGDSEWATGSSYQVIDYVPDLVALIDLVGGKAPIVAHSLGGWITLLTAGIFPERFDRIIAIEGTGEGLNDRKPMTAERLRTWVSRARAMEARTPRVYPSFAAAAERVHEANPALTEEMAAHLARWGTNVIDNGWVWKFDPWLRNQTPLELVTEELHEVWRNVTCPMLHIVGERSYFKHPHFAERTPHTYFRDSRTEVVKDAGHWVHHDRLDEVVGLIRDFLGPPPPAPTAD